MTVSRVRWNSFVAGEIDTPGLRETLAQAHYGAKSRALSTSEITVARMWRDKCKADQGISVRRGE
jgi:hypothetical protein